MMMRVPDIYSSKVFIFGASFNPVHNGHLFLADQLAQEPWIKKVVFLPCGNQHPFGKELVDAEDRYQMLDLAIRSDQVTQAHKMEVSRLEIDQTDICFTYETLQRWRALYPEEDFVFNLGSDSLREIEKWHRYQDLLNEFEFLVTDRPGKNVDWQKLAHWPKIKVWNLKQKSQVLSSTEIRHKIKNGQSITGLVPTEVEKYIHENYLYE